MLIFRCCFSISINSLNEHWFKDMAQKLFQMFRMQLAAEYEELQGLRQTAVLCSVSGLFFLFLLVDGMLCEVNVLNVYDFIFYSHYPQQKPTVVSDNPELLRIKENTKIQSNVIFCSYSLLSYAYSKFYF